MKQRRAVTVVGIHVHIIACQVVNFVFLKTSHKQMSSQVHLKSLFP